MEEEEEEEAPVAITKNVVLDDGTYATQTTYSEVTKKVCGMDEVGGGRGVMGFVAGEWCRGPAAALSPWPPTRDCARGPSLPRPPTPSQPPPPSPFTHPPTPSQPPTPPHPHRRRRS